jgi:hypothetical protein
VQSIVHSLCLDDPPRGDKFSLRGGFVLGNGGAANPGVEQVHRGGGNLVQNRVVGQFEI